MTVLLVAALTVLPADGPSGPWAPVASAVGTGTALAAPGESRVALYAERLRSDPVFVSPSLRRVVSAEDEAALRRDVAAMPYPTYVVVAPAFRDEPDLESFPDLATLLRDRLGRDGLYLVADENGSGLGADAFGVRTRGDTRGLISTVLGAVPRGDGPVARVRFALEHLRTGATATGGTVDDDASDDARFFSILGVSTLVGLVVPLGIAASTPGGRRRRAERRRARLAARDARIAAAPAVAPPVERGEARRDAQDAVAGLARAIAEADAPPDRALRTYDAASHALGREDATPMDLVGARALADAGRAQLRGASWRPCLFDPRHGEGDRPTRWRRDGQDAVIPACADCAALLADGKAPPVLQDRGRPYWERDTVWARTGFGAIDDDVADAVLAGGRTVR
ncbi:unannotated protein [freshwater metagenome]|uniref:Unannotated protein n=1 Tax=freshwater metagenome TaxID=449393 RepID=A0A6J7HVE6_9ZZZZ|nr:hypothetical protein [Actinomycetota bacterium]